MAPGAGNIDALTEGVDVARHPLARGGCGAPTDRATLYESRKIPLAR